MIEAQVREWCEQILVEVVLAACNSRWTEDQLDALLSPISFTATLLPRHLLHATLQTRLAQKLGPPRSDAGEPAPDASVTARRQVRSRGPGDAQPAEKQLRGERGESPRSWLGTDMDTRVVTVDQPDDVITRGRVARSLSPP